MSRTAWFVLPFLVFPLAAAAASSALGAKGVAEAGAFELRPGILGIVVLDRGDGTRRLAVDVALPEGVKASVADRLGSTFRAWASVDNGQIVLGWENVLRRVSPIPPKRGEKMRSLLTGGARLDLAAKTAIALAAAPPRPESPIARLASDNGPATERLQAGSIWPQLRWSAMPARDSWF